VGGIYVTGSRLDEQAGTGPQSAAGEHPTQVPGLGPERSGLKHAALEGIRRRDVLDSLADHRDGSVR
jgi:hypothetical protein